MKQPRLVGCALAAGLALSPGAQAQDAGDLAFWQSVQTSTNPAELKLYLQSYPNGRFAELARIRIQALIGGKPPVGPATPDPEPEAGPEPTIAVSPPAGRVGQRFVLKCVNFPQPAFDVIVVVPAGTPVMDPNQSRREENRVLSQNYVSTGCTTTGVEVGPFAPGAYEARWFTTLYNNDPNQRYEMKAMSRFTIR